MTWIQQQVLHNLQVSQTMGDLYIPVPWSQQLNQFLPTISGSLPGFSSLLTPDVPHATDSILSPFLILESPSEPPHQIHPSCALRTKFLVVILLCPLILYISNMSPDAGIGPISVSSSNSSPCTDILFQCSMCKLVSPGKGTSTHFNQPAIPFFLPFLYKISNLQDQSLSLNSSCIYGQDGSVMFKHTKEWFVVRIYYKPMTIQVLVKIFLLRM